MGRGAGPAGDPLAWRRGGLTVVVFGAILKIAPSGSDSVRRESSLIDFAPLLAARRTCQRASCVREPQPRDDLFVKSTTNDGGARDWRPAPGEAGETPAWPVLASLPRVGVHSEPQSAPLRTETPIEHARAQGYEAAPLRIATPAAAPEDFEPLAITSQSSVGASIQFRTFIDQAHLSVRGYDLPSVGEHRSAEPPAAWPAPASTHRRIDAASRRLGEPAPIKPPLKAVEPNCSSLTAKVFQIHAAVAPYAGMMMTLALAASVGLLCWMTMGRPHAAATNESVLGRPAAWPAETATKPLPADADRISAAPEQFVSEFAWRMTPSQESEESTAAQSNPKRVAEAAPSSAKTDEIAVLATPQLDLNEPAEPSAVASTGDAATPTTAESSPTETAAASVAATAPPVTSTPAEQPTAPRTSEPITPTPPAGPFPTTPYGAFNYFAQPSPGTPNTGESVTQESVVSRPGNEAAAATR